MRLKLILIALFSSSHILANNHAPQNDVVKDLQQCRRLSPMFERLDCYDNIKTGEISTALLDSEKKGGTAWQRAQQQESERKDQHLQFIVTTTEEPQSSVVLTAPSLGYPFPRPILMLSCIDNITRLQLALPKSLAKKESIQIQLSTEKMQFSSQWFVREDGFLLEASRGLDGIKEIQRLFNANTLKIKLENNIVNPLTFNIEGLEEKIKPLRTACHW